jgi:hypothetical protein
LHLAPEDELTAAAARVRDLAAQHQTFRTRLDDRQRQMAHSEDLDWVGYYQTALPFRDSRRDPILQPPMPRITPSAEILQLAAEHDIEPEAES